MRSVSVRLADLSRVTIPVGFVGENEYTMVVIDCKKVFDEHPTAVATMTVAPPNGDPYPTVVVRDGDMVIWNVSSSDVVHDGIGEIQLTFVIGEKIGKSYKGRISINSSILPSGEMPTPIENWIDDANGVLAEAETAIASIEGMTVDADTFPEGSSATAEVSDVGDHKHIQFGIPKGDTGNPGKDGKDGQDGHSPVVTANKSGKITTVSVDGTPIATINDGENGHSPVMTASKSGKVTTVSVDGSAIATINDGEDGQNGQDGITPNIQVGTTTTGDAGTNASVTRRVGSPDSSPVFDFVIPKGAKGDAGNGDMLAPAFAEATANAAGTYVTYNGGMYLLPNGHLANVTWANTTKTQVNIGSQVSDLKSALSHQRSIIGKDVNGTSLWENGSISTSSGSEGSNSARLRTKTYISPSVSDIQIPTGYKLIIYGWNGDTYLGVWSGTDFSTSTTKKWSAGSVSIITINQYKIRLCLERTDSGNISPSESAGVELWEFTDKSLAVNGMSADAKIVGDRIETMNADLETQISDKADKNLFSEQAATVNLLDVSDAVTGAIMSDGSISTVGAYGDYKTAYLKLPAGTYTEYAFTTASETNISTSRRLYLIKKTSDGTTTYVNQNSVETTSFTLTEECEIWYSRGIYNTYPTLERAMIVAGATITSSYIPYVCVKSLKPSILVGNNVLYGKKWCPCGDSFTAYTDEFFTEGQYYGKYKTYPYLIAERNGINLVETFFASGRTLAMPAQPGTFTNSLCNSSATFYYQNIPADADIITIYLGINDAHHAPGSSGGDGEDNTGEIPIGTVNDNTTATYGGAWNVVLTWLMTNRPNAHIGIIVSNGMNNIAYRELVIAIAKKYGIAYIDLNGDHLTTAMSRPQNTDIADAVKTILLNKWSVDPATNTHPNAVAHKFESFMIEDFIRRI